MKRLVSGIMLTLLLTSALALAFNVPVGAATTQLEVIAPAGPITVPRQFSVDINVTDVTDLFLWQIKLYYNPTLLRWINATLPPGHVFYGKPMTIGGPNNETDPDGTFILLAVALQGDVARFNGDGILCRIYFEAQAVGTSALDFSKPYGDDTFMLNYDLLTITADVADSSITTQGADTRAPTAISMSIDKRSLVIGENVTISGTINVTVPDGTPVYIEYYGHDAWSPLATVYTEDSNYTYNWAPTDEGDFKIRSKWDGDGINYKPATSEEVASAVSARAPDIAVTNATLSKTVVGQGYSMNITVIVYNQGELTETFNVTVYCNETAITLPNEENYTTVTLASGESTTITFTWNTTGFAYGNYNISANAEPVPGETDTTDNTLADGWVLVTIPGDVNGDFKCEGKDIAIIAKAYGSLIGQPAYVPNADINDDGKIDGKDIAVAAKYYGTHYP